MGPSAVVTLTAGNVSPANCGRFTLSTAVATQSAACAIAPTSMPSHAASCAVVHLYAAMPRTQSGAVRKSDRNPDEALRAVWMVCPAADSALTITATACCNFSGTLASAICVAFGSKLPSFHVLARLPSAIVSGAGSVPSTMNHDGSGHIDGFFPMRTAAAAMALDTGVAPPIAMSSQLAVSVP